MGNMNATDKIQLLFDRRGWKYPDLERAAGLPFKKVAKWYSAPEKRKNPVVLEHAVALNIARALHVPVEWLIDDAQDWPPPAGTGDDQLVLAMARTIGLERARLRLMHPAPGEDAYATPAPALPPARRVSQPEPRRPGRSGRAG